MVPTARPKGLKGLEVLMLSYVPQFPFGFPQSMLSCIDSEDYWLPTLISLPVPW